MPRPEVIDALDHLDQLTAELEAQSRVRQTAELEAAAAEQARQQAVAEESSALSSQRQAVEDLKHLIDQLYVSTR